MKTVDLADVVEVLVITVVWLVTLDYVKYVGETIGMKLGELGERRQQRDDE